VSRTFSITLTAEERFAILVGLGWLWTAMEKCPDAITKPVAALIDKLSTAPGQDALTVEETRRMGQQKDDPHMANAASGAAPAHAILSPPAPTDYFAADRSGKIPTTPPKKAELWEKQTIVGSTDKGKYLKVIIPQHSANCFDKQLWPFLAGAGKEVGLWILKSDDGKYLNIVGVRA